MSREYSQHVITASGELRSSMYSAGPSCESIELARELGGGIHYRTADGERLAIVRRDVLPGLWIDSGGQAHRRYDRPVVVEILSLG